MWARIYRKLFWWERKFSSCKPLFKSGIDAMTWDWSFVFHSLVFVDFWHFYILDEVELACLKKKKKSVYTKESWLAYTTFMVADILHLLAFLCSVFRHFISHCFFEIWTFVWCIFRGSWIELSFKMSKVCFFSCSLLPRVVWHLCNLPQHMLCCLRSFLLQEMF